MQQDNDLKHNNEHNGLVKVQTSIQLKHHGGILLAFGFQYQQAMGGTVDSSTLLLA